MNLSNSFEVGNSRGWYVVRFYALNRPNEVKWYSVLFLDEPAEVRTRGQWKRFLGKLLSIYSRFGDQETPVVDKIPSFLQNYVKKYHKDFPGVYSIGPFETRERAKEAVGESENWWSEKAHMFLGPEGLDQYVPDEGTGNPPYQADPYKKEPGWVKRPLTSTVLEDGRIVAHENYEQNPTQGRDSLKEGGLRYTSQNPDQDWLTKREKVHSEIMDVTDPENWVTYPSLTECAKALGLKPYQVQNVCNRVDGRKQVKGRVLRYADPAGYGVPVVWVRYTRRDSKGNLVEDIQLEPDYETINSFPGEPTGGCYRVPEPPVPNPVDWRRKDRVRFSNLIR